MINAILIDNYDSFTYNLKDYLEQAGLSIEVYRNDEISIKTIDSKKIDAIILSPGPGKPAEVPLLAQCIELSIRKEIPLLGICLGHQAIGEYFGFSTQKAPLPVHGKTDYIQLDSSSPLFMDIDSPTEVMRYHSLIIKGSHPEINILATNSEGIIMAMQHSNKPIFSVQFHPESILTTQGLKLLKNWVKLYSNYE
jgi:anthranilate synthase/aminodeoxychorismate synthase-like glutamine amidotransferase